MPTVAIDLTMSDSEDSAPVRTPVRQGQIQAQAVSRPQKPISPPALSRQPAEASQSNTSSITAAPSSRGQKVAAEENNKYVAGRNSSIAVKPLFKSSHNPQSSTPPSAKKQQAGEHRTPKNQTPKKGEWTVEKLEEKLRRFAEDIGADTAKLTASLVQTSWKHKHPQRRFISKTDCFANMRLKPAEATAKSSDTMRIKTKVCSSEKRPFERVCIADCSIASRPR